MKHGSTPTAILLNEGALYAGSRNDDGGESMGTKGQQRQLSKSLVVILIITFSFIAGVMTAAGTYILLRKSGHTWMFELAMALFLLISAVSYALQLVRRPESDGVPTASLRGQVEKIP
jgi:hypothetical protein